jgi:hypothetical protein
MPNHSGRLVLAPRNPYIGPERDSLLHTLSDEGLLGLPLGPGHDAYAVGEAFLGLITFAGCAVRLEVEPSAGGARPPCHIVVAGPYIEPVILTGRNTRPPRCPACRTPLRGWRDAVHGPMAFAGLAPPLPCRACGTAPPACECDWKETGGCARLWLAVEGVFPGEAAPTDSLMEILAKAAQAPWRYFYIQD